MRADIRVYRYSRSDHNNTELVAVAPLEMKQAVAVAVQKRNEEAVEANSYWRYGYDVEASISVFNVGDEVKIP